MDDLEQRMYDEHTTATTLQDEDFPDAHVVFLRVGVQHFCITPTPCESAEQATWLRHMLARALAGVVLEERVTERDSARRDAEQLAAGTYVPAWRFSELEAERDRLREALLTIRRGKMPEDRGLYEIMAARLVGVAAGALED